jgi:hypothetical protein
MKINLGKALRYLTATKEEKRRLAKEYAEEELKRVAARKAKRHRQEIEEFDRDSS